MPVFVGLLQHEHGNCSILRAPRACVLVERPKTKSALTSDVFPVMHPKLIISDTELATDMQLGHSCCHLQLLWLDERNYAKADKESQCWYAAGVALLRGNSSLQTVLCCRKLNVHTAACKQE